MKESKFIELLNLYLDHHISPAEMELLESEVRTNPAHRRIYREYCQMQKGCTELAANFRAQAPVGDPALVEFKRHQSRIGVMAYATGFVAAVACVAVVFTLRSRPPERVITGLTGHDQMALAPGGSAPSLVTPIKTPAPAVTAAVAVRPALQPVFGPRLLTVREPAADLAEASTDQAAFAEWMNGIQFSSLPGVSVDELRFDAHANLQPDIRSYRAGRPVQGKVEATAAAFTFQK